MRRSFLIVALLVLVVGFAVGLRLAKQRATSPESPPMVPEQVETAPPEPAATQMPQQQQSPSPAQSEMAVAPKAEPSAETRAVISALTQIKGPINAEMALAWKSNLTQLIQQGAAAVPGIREFLSQNKDIPYDYKQGGDLIGAHSLRLGLLQALEAMGSPEAMQLALDTLQTTTEPREIAQIAKHLEAQAEGQHREAILNATRESLAMAAAGKLGGTDPGPLFNLIAQYGGPDAAADFQKTASPLRYYSALGLAQLPDGAGIATLGQMLRQPNGPPRATHNAALEALAQLAPTYPAARDLILQQALAGSIPETLWPSLAESFAGARFFILNPAEEGLTPQSGDKTYHLAQGPQNFFSRANAVHLSPEQRQQMSHFIDQLLQTQVPALGLESLQRSKEKLGN